MFGKSKGDLESRTLQHCRSRILRLLGEGYDQVTVAETVGCPEYAVTRAMATAKAYDRDIARALADCREGTSGITRSAWHKGEPADGE